MMDANPNQQGNATEVRVDYYEVLNVPFGANKGLIRESYVRLKSAFSAQSNAFYSLISEEEAQSMLGRIEEAFRVLNDDLRRKEYDKILGLDGEENLTPDPMFQRTARSSAMMPRVDLGLPASFNEESSSANVHRPNRSVMTTAQSAPANVVAKRPDGELKTKMEDIIQSGDSEQGTILARLRELVGVSIDEVQTRTKISAEYIKAIETNEFATLPQPVFVKGFLRSYLRYLSVPDSDRLVAAFAQRHDEWLKKAQKTS
jgi:hypothetical protein